MTGRDQQQGRYWPTDPAAYTGPAATPAAGPARARVLHITAGEAEIIVPRHEAADGPEDAPTDVFGLYPELRPLAELAHAAAELAADTSSLMREGFERLGGQIDACLRLIGQGAVISEQVAERLAELDRRVAALESPAAGPEGGR